MQEASDFYAEEEPKGECILVIEGLSREAIEKEAQQKWEAMSIEEHLQMYLDQESTKRSDEAGRERSWHFQAGCVCGKYIIRTTDEDK